MEVAFAQYCEQDDIITPITTEYEAMRKERGVTPRNCGGFWNHMAASEVKSRVGNKIWGSYFKFCFERNPWDKMVSYYFHKREGNSTFSDFVNGRGLNGDGYGGIDDFDRYSENGKVIVDQVFLYEHFQDSLSYLAKRLDLPGLSQRMPRAKGDFRTDRSHYSTFFNPELIEAVRNRFTRAIELFGYEFESPCPTAKCHPMESPLRLTAIGKRRRIQP